MPCLSIQQHLATSIITTVLSTPRPVDSGTHGSRRPDRQASKGRPSCYLSDPDSGAFWMWMGPWTPFNGVLSSWIFFTAIGWPIRGLPPLTHSFPCFLLPFLSKPGLNAVSLQSTRLYEVPHMYSTLLHREVSPF